MRLGSSLSSTPSACANSSRPSPLIELRQALPGIGPRTLASRLRQFERHAIVIRIACAEIPPRVECRLAFAVRDCAMLSTPWRPGSSRSPSWRLPSWSRPRGRSGGGERGLRRTAWSTAGGEILLRCAAAHVRHRVDAADLPECSARCRLTGESDQVRGGRSPYATGWRRGCTGRWSSRSPKTWCSSLGWTSIFSFRRTFISGSCFHGIYLSSVASSVPGGGGCAGCSARRVPIRLYVSPCCCESEGECVMPGPSLDSVAAVDFATSRRGERSYVALCDSAYVLKTDTWDGLPLGDDALRPALRRRHVGVGRQGPQLGCLLRLCSGHRRGRRQC
ncbi:winged helix-turn-helix transcriptional regulator [Streptomyces europaeiscabiei]|uniref:winged helix-turn-helix transcriptional regulator n=1 Tax=Streptomyces europaeiscabiei TaxID=146819 RepID=UPI002E1992B5